jgi:DNA-binding transcriptional LysR family regulator
MIRLQRLEGFYWVARTGGYSRAARAFPYPITQPGVYRQVQRLSAELGVTLFERTGRDQVVLTSAGRALHDFVAPFMERLPAVARSLRTGEQGGTLRMHASNLVLRHLLPPWLLRLRRARPDIQVHLSEAKTPDLALLRLGETDLLVDHLPEVPGDVEARRIGTVRGFLVLPASHPRARMKTLSPDLLAEEPFIGYSSDRYLLDLQLRALALHGVHPQRLYSAESAETILGFVAAGLGYSIVPSFQPSGPRERGVVARPLLRPRADFPIYAAWRRGEAPQPLVEAALALAPEDNEARGPA